MKSFIEAFPQLKEVDELQEVMQFLSVDRVSSNTDLSELRIYISANRLIEKKLIYDMERLIKDKLFPHF